MMSLEEFARRVEDRIAVSGANSDGVRQFVKTRWYRIENAYEDASAADSESSYENEIITVSYAMSLDYRLASA